jgi:GTPase SAR1 family protein
MERHNMTHARALPDAPQVLNERISAARYLAGLVVSLLAGLIAYWIAPKQVSLAVNILIWSTVGFYLIRLILAIRSYLAMLHVKVQIGQEQLMQQRLFTEQQQFDNRKAIAEVRKIEAEARKTEREANTIVTVAKPGEQVYLTEVDHNTTTRPLHLSPGLVNGRVWYDDEELRRWALFNALHAPGQRRPDALGPGPALGLPAGPVDLLTALDNERRVLVVGPSNAGKTTLLHHLTQRQYNRSKVVVIDPHASPQKWGGHSHRVFGVGRNYAEVEWGLRELLKLMLKRYDDIGRGLAQEETHPPISILIDEWRAIIENVDGSASTIKTLLTESRKAAFAVFLASHSERAKPLGLAGEYDLKDGFAIVRLSIINGQRAATLDTGNGEIPVVLPGSFFAGSPPLLQGEGLGERSDDAAALVEGDYTPELLPEPTGKQQKIIDLWDAGEHALSAIAREVYDDGGGRQCELVRKTLEKFGRI